MFSSDAYTVADIAGSEFDLVSLDDEIRAALLTDYVRVSKHGAEVRAIFSTSPSGPTITALDGVMAAHTGTPPATPKKDRDPVAGDPGTLCEIRVNESESAKHAFVCVDSTPGSEVWKKIT
jgi:hypothetical protein